MRVENTSRHLLSNIRNHRPRLIRAIAVCVLNLFFIEQVVWAAPSPVLSLGLKRGVSIASKVQKELGISASVARVEEVFDAGLTGGGRTVYLLKDAHTNPSAQINLSKTLRTLIAKKDVRHVFTEAGEGDNSLTFLRRYGTAAVREKTAMADLHKGEMKGAEYLSLASEEDFVIWGVEDRALYVEALDAYREVVEGQSRALAFVGRLQAAADVLREKVFNFALADLFKKRASHRRGELPFCDYLDVLFKRAKAAGADLEHYPHLNEARALIAAEERIDFETAEEEQKRLLELLTVSERDEALRRFRDGHAPGKIAKLERDASAAFYALIGEKLKGRGGEFAELRRYVLYLEKAETLDAALILKEQKALESRLFDLLAQTGDEGRLAGAMERIDFFRKLVELKLTPGDFDAHVKDGEDRAAVFGFLNTLLMRLDAPHARAILLDETFERTAAAAETFYRNSFRRDLKFIENLSAKMKAENENEVVLITGGFHAPNLKALLRQRKISYVCLMPQVGHATDHGRYERLLLSQKADGVVEPSSASDNHFAMDILNWTLRKTPEEIRFFANAMAKESGIRFTVAGSRLAHSFGKQHKPNPGIYSGDVTQEETRAALREAVEEKGVEEVSMKRFTVDMLELDEASAFAGLENQAGAAWRDEIRDGFGEMLIGIVRTDDPFLFYRDRWKFQVSLADVDNGIIYVTEGFWKMTSDCKEAREALIGRAVSSIVNAGDLNERKKAARSESEFDPEAKLRWLIDEAVMLKENGMTPGKADRRSVPPPVFVIEECISASWTLVIEKFKSLVKLFLMRLQRHAEPVVRRSRGMRRLGFSQSQVNTILGENTRDRIASLAAIRDERDISQLEVVQAALHDENAAVRLLAAQTIGDLVILNGVNAELISQIAPRWYFEFMRNAHRGIIFDDFIVDLEVIAETAESDLVRTEAYAATDAIRWAKNTLRKTGRLIPDQGARLAEDLRIASPRNEQASDSAMPPAAGSLDGIVLVRYATYYGAGGGVHEHLGVLNNELLKQNDMTIYQVYPARGNAPREVRRDKRGKGELILWPISSQTTAAGGAEIETGVLQKMLPLWAKERIKIYLSANPKRLERFKNLPVIGGPIREALSREELLSPVLEQIRRDHRSDPILFVNHSPGSFFDLNVVHFVKAAGDMAVACEYHGGYQTHAIQSLMGLAARVYDAVGVVTTHGLKRSLRDQVADLGNIVDGDFFSRKEAGTGFREEHSIDKDAFVILDSASVVPGKGPEDLLEASRIVARNNPDRSIVVVFAGNELRRFQSLSQQLRQRTQEDPKNLRVIVAGYLTQEEMRDAYAGSDVEVLPGRRSYSEGLSRSLIEAGAMGLPVVATDNGGTRVIVEDGVNGFVVRPRLPRAMGRAIQELLDDPSLRERMGEEGRAKAALYSPENATKLHGKFYLEALAAYSRRKPKSASAKQTASGVIQAGARLAGDPAAEFTDEEHATAGEIAKIVSKLNEQGLHPKINGMALYDLANIAAIYDAVEGRTIPGTTQLLRHIRGYSVVADLELMYRILLSYSEINSFKEKPFIPEGLTKELVEDIYAALFEQGRYIADKPLKIVVIRGGSGSGPLVDKLMQLGPNVSVTAVLGATDDGRSWAIAARDFDATGVPDGGKSLLDFAPKSAMKEVLSFRFSDKRREVLFKDLEALIGHFKLNIQAKYESEDMRQLHMLVAKCAQDERVSPEQIEALLDALEKLSVTLRSRYPGSLFTLHRIAVRSAVLLGAAWQERESDARGNYWQKALDRTGKMLGVPERHRVMYPTSKRMHLVAMTEDGRLFATETGINELPKYKQYLGLWLFEKKIDIDKLSGWRGRWWRLLGIPINKISVSADDIHKRPLVLSDAGMMKEIRESVRKVPTLFARYVARVISGYSATGRYARQKIDVEDDVKQVIAEADAIIYGTTTMEANLGSAVILPGVSDAIRENKRAVRIQMPNPTIEADMPGTTAIHLLERLGRYMSGKLLHHAPEFDYREAAEWIDVIIGIGKNYPKRDREKTYIPFDPAVLHRLTDGRVTAIGLNLEDENPSKAKAILYEEGEKQWGFYEPNLTVEAIVALTGLKKAGFRVDPKGSLESVSASRLAAAGGYHLSPAKANIPMNGMFSPLMQMRSKRDWGAMNFREARKVAKAHSGLGLNIMQWFPISRSSAYNSRYSVESSRLISPEYISVEGILDEFDSADGKAFVDGIQKELEALRARDRVDYEKVTELTEKGIEIIWNELKEQKDHPLYAAFLEYLEQNADWLPDHVLYGELKQEYFEADPLSGWDWRTWNDRDEGLSDYALSKGNGESNAAIERARVRHKEGIDFRMFMQFIADRQLQELIDYSESLDVHIMMDIPVAVDGADIWLNPRVFGLKKENGYRRLTSQGVPNEPGNEKGQYWQFYLYDWEYEGTFKFWEELFGFTQTRAKYIRLDHVLGFYRAFHYTEDIDDEMTLEKLHVFADLERIRQEALISENPDAKKEAVQKVMGMLKRKLMMMRMTGTPPGLPEDAVQLMFDDQGNRGENNFVSIAREVPESQHSEKLPKESPWVRNEVVEKKIYRRSPLWDSIRLTPNENLEDEGFLMQYLFPDDEAEAPRPTDSLRLGYFKLTAGEKIMSVFNRLAQQRGTVVVSELLGSVIPAIEESTKRMDGINYIPVMWFLDNLDYWIFKAKKLVRAFVCGSLHDTVSLKTELKTKDNFGDSPEEYERALETIYKIPALMTVPNWIDILGLGDEYRLNVPGEQTGQWEPRLPQDFTVEALLAAIEGRDEDSTRIAIDAVARLKRLLALRPKAPAPSGKTEIVNVEPTVGESAVEQCPVGEAFLVDAYIRDEAQKVELVVLAEAQKEAAEEGDAGTEVREIRVPMKITAVGSGVTAGITKWTADEWFAEKAGEHRFWVEVTAPDGEVIRSGDGILWSTDVSANLNPLSVYYAGSSPDSIATSAARLAKAGNSNDAPDLVAWHVPDARATYLVVRLSGQEPKPFRAANRNKLITVLNEEMTSLDMLPKEVRFVPLKKDRIRMQAPGGISAEFRWNNGAEIRRALAQLEFYHIINRSEFTLDPGEGVHLLDSDGNEIHKLMYEGLIHGEQLGGRFWLRTPVESGQQDPVQYQNRQIDVVRGKICALDESRGIYLYFRFAVGARGEEQRQFATVEILGPEEIKKVRDAEWLGGHAPRFKEWFRGVIRTFNKTGYFLLDNGAVELKVVVKNMGSWTGSDYSEIALEVTGTNGFYDSVVLRMREEGWDKYIPDPEDRFEFGDVIVSPSANQKSGGRLRLIASAPQDVKIEGVQSEAVDSGARLAHTDVSRSPQAAGEFMRMFRRFAAGVILTLLTPMTAEAQAMPHLFPVELQDGRAVVAVIGEDDESVFYVRQEIEGPAFEPLHIAREDLRKEAAASLKTNSSANADSGNSGSYGLERAERRRLIADLPPSVRRSVAGIVDVGPVSKFEANHPLTRLYLTAAAKTFLNGGYLRFADRSGERPDLVERAYGIAEAVAKGLSQESPGASARILRTESTPSAVMEVLLHTPVYSTDREDSPNRLHLTMETLEEGYFTDILSVFELLKAAGATVKPVRHPETGRIYIPHGSISQNLVHVVSSLVAAEGPLSEEAVADMFLLDPEARFLVIRPEAVDRWLVLIRMAEQEAGIMA